MLEIGQAKCHQPFMVLAMPVMSSLSAFSLIPTSRVPPPLAVLTEMNSAFHHQSATIQAAPFASLVKLSHLFAV